MGATSLSSQALSRICTVQKQVRSTREGEWIAVRRSQPWIAAQQSIAHENRFVALQINLIRFFYV
jgi:hypothetical protein